MASRKYENGEKSTPEYMRWRAMKNRAMGHGAWVRKYYGDNGVGMDPRWTEFSVFLQDMGPCPAGWTLDRIDNSKGYSKDNCRWATRKTQSQNRRKDNFIRGDAHWARKAKIARESKVQ